MQARFYDPTAGTFISRDTYNVPNRYNYANANPVNATDPTGHFVGLVAAPAIDSTLADAAAGCVIGPEGCVAGAVVRVSPPPRQPCCASCSAAATTTRSPRSAFKQAESPSGTTSRTTPTAGTPTDS